MRFKQFMRMGNVTAIAVVLLVACSAPVSQTHSIPSSPTTSPLPAPTQMSGPTSLPLPNLAPTDDCSQTGCIQSGHAWLAWPIDGDAGGKVDPTYRYASTAAGKREPHTGVEIQAPAGEIVRAAADGVVVAAGDLTGGAYDALRSYGNVVVLRHDISDLSQPLFTLYAHLDQVKVGVNQILQTGDPLGTVGATGIATGPHLHFEIRLGPGTTGNTVNPELWLTPHNGSNGQPNAALAGKILNPDGTRASVSSIVIQPMLPVDSTHRPIYLDTYAAMDTHGDINWQENFAAGDLPPGTYRLAFIAGANIIDQQVTLEAGKITFVIIQLKTNV